MTRAPEVRAPADGPWALLLAVVGLPLLPIALVGLALAWRASSRRGHEPAPWSARAAVVLCVVSALATFAAAATFGALYVFESAQHDMLFASCTQRTQAHVAEVFLHRALVGIQGAKASNPTAFSSNLGPAPTRPPCEAIPWPHSADPRWTTAFSGSPPARTRFSYEYLVASGASLGHAEHATVFTLRARGDLDCDGETSMVELVGAFAADGTLSHLGGVYVESRSE